MISALLYYNGTDCKSAIHSLNPRERVVGSENNLMGTTRKFEFVFSLIKNAIVMQIYTIIVKNPLP